MLSAVHLWNSNCFRILPICLSWTQLLSFLFFRHTKLRCGGAAWSERAVRCCGDSACVARTGLRGRGCWTWQGTGRLCPHTYWYLLTSCSGQIHLIDLAQMIILVQSSPVLVLTSHQLNPNDNWNIAEIGIPEAWTSTLQSFI